MYLLIYISINLFLFIYIHLFHLHLLFEIGMLALNKFEPLSPNGVFVEAGKPVYYIPSETVSVVHSFPVHVPLAFTNDVLFQDQLKLVLWF